MNETATRRPPRRVAWQALIALSAFVVFVPSAIGYARTDLFWPVVELGLALSAFAGIGALLAVRRPANPIGSLLVAVGALMSATLALSAYATVGVAAGSVPLPGADIAGTLTEIVFIAPLAIGLVGVPLVFPDGHLLSARWRWVVVVAAASVLAEGTASLIDPGIVSTTGMPNPLGVPGAAALADVLNAVAVGGFVAALLASATNLWIRFRTGSSLERQQLKWLLAAAGFGAVLYPIAFLTPAGPASNAKWALANLAFVALPVAIGVAVLRYRLYDLDLLVNRTVVYGSVTVILALAFGVTDIGLQRALEAVTGQRSDIVSGALGVGAALAFGPMRRTTRPLVDRVLPSRAMLSLVFNDIVGSTEHLVRLGDERWRSLLERYHATVRSELAHHGGREVNTAGDGFFATFDRPTAATAFSVSLRHTVAALGLETRTGIHLGECEMRGEQPSGLAVHTAARIMAAAGADEILVSRAVIDGMADDDAAFADRGSFELKGVPGQWELYELKAGGEALG